MDPSGTFALPPVMWNDLKQVLGLLVQSRIATLTNNQTGHYTANKLAPLIDQVRKLLRARQGTWPDDTLASLRFAFAMALSDYGEQAGNNDALAESADTYRLVLTVWTRDCVPLDWAATQNNLGSALSRIGERESRTTHLEQAVAAFQAALQELTRERFPLAWALTQNNLGNALFRLGERENGTAHLEQAVAAYQNALEERTRERVPLDWAMTQNSLGNALELLAKRRGDARTMDQALTCMRGAEEVYRESGNGYWTPITQRRVRALEAEVAAMRR